MFQDFFNTTTELSLIAIVLRSIIMYFVALVLLRIGGIRIIGKKTGMDLVIIIMLGSILTRGIMEHTSFLTSIVVGTIMVSVNRFLVWLSAKSNRVNYFFKGKPLLLFDHGELLWENMTAAAISLSEIITSLRLETNSESFEGVARAYLEPNGKISFVFKAGHH
ncbi:DUF421 domain-containing protein [Flavobacterium sp. JP2137]|uniref:DUF421 domain-containing protein n=1 Tax=Flavobacterium sp. JP2137 TaxID=3414510 RepID=UPI003D2FC9D2